MNVYVMVDIEGISGVYTKEQVLPLEARFAEGRRYMTRDVNCCVEGLKAAGVDKVYVRDCHGGSYAFCWEDLTAQADYYICGNMPEKRFLGIEECDALVLLGYHAMAGTKDAVLEHTYSSKSVQNMYINDRKVGELAVDAAIAGELGIPVIMVSGDDKTCQEAEAFLPGVTTACVKKGMSTYGAMLLPQEKAHELIRNKAMEAVEKAKDRKPFTFEKPLECKVEVMERTLIQNGIKAPFVDIIDGRTYRVTGDTMEEVFFRSMSVR